MSCLPASASTYKKDGMLLKPATAHFAKAVSESSLLEDWLLRSLQRLLQPKLLLFWLFLQSAFAHLSFSQQQATPSRANHWDKEIELSLKLAHADRSL